MKKNIKKKKKMTKQYVKALYVAAEAMLFT